VILFDEGREFLGREEGDAPDPPSRRQAQETRPRNVLVGIDTLPSPGPRGGDGLVALFPGSQELRAQSGEQSRDLNGMPFPSHESPTPHLSMYCTTIIRQILDIWPTRV